ncbi:extracellular solute-binding protein [Halegenticoccus soli]|uniref:extracellular solute-binding protein n=1 Tax=Halegenticoccus soli TaxID=1985678 RepID=UPI001E5C230A|nr:extracellular solute-binding protein [Halegenticoccus soli]
MLALGGAAAVAGLGGCVGTGDPNAADDSAGDGGNDMAAKATGWAWDVAAKSLDLTDEPYEKRANGNADVTIEQYGHDALVDKFKSALLSGSGAPDFSILESVVAPSFIGTGGLRDLSDRISDAGLKSAFVSGKWEAITGEDGGVYALPWDIGPVGVFYRRDVYEAHGIDPSSIETWEQYVEAGRKLPDDVFMGNLPPNDLAGVWRMQFRQLGGEPFTADGAVNVHSEASVRVARHIRDLEEAGIVANMQSWSSSWFSAYGEGKIASLPAGAWMEGTLRDSLPKTSGKWGVYALPAFETGGNRATNWGGSNLCIPKQTDDAVANRAWDYVKFALSTPEMQNEMYEKYGIFPALKAAYDADLYGAKVDFFGGQRIRRIFAELSADIPGYRFTADTPEVTEAMGTHLQRMLDGKYGPKEAVTKAAEQVAERTDRDLA